MIPMPRLRVFARPWALLACLALTACAEAPVAPPPSDPLFADGSFAPPSDRVTQADVFQVSPEMHRYLETRVAELANKHGEARGLLESLFKDKRVQVDYDAEFTRTAAQAFDARAGNCLSLAIVTGAMAKELGLEVSYQSVQTAEHWEREGDLLELVGHVNVTLGWPIPKARTWGFPTDRWTVDFMPESDLRHLVTEPITEARVAAMFMNNRAAEALAAKRVDDAYWWVRSGLEADPGFVALYNTLGVTYVRKGMTHQAETAFRQALAKSAYSQESWNNLAALLRHDGRVQEAVAIEQAHPPSKAAAMVVAIDDGIRANAVGDYPRALELFKHALRTSGDSHRLHYLLAVTYLNLGDRRSAMAQLQEAREDSLTTRQRTVYTSKIEMLKSTTSSFRLDPNAAQVN